MKEKIIEIVGFNMEPEKSELIAQQVLDLFAVSGSLPDKAMQLLKIAKCPCCDGSGTIVYTTTQDGEIEDIGPCQWCHERNELVGNDP